MSKLCIISLFAVSSVLLAAQSVRSAAPPASPPKDNNPYILQDFDNEEVVELINGSQVCDKCWKNPNSYEVCFTRMGGRAPEYFTWKNEEIPFELRTAKFKKSGGYSQTWLFENGGINFYRGANGGITQTWDLPNTTWKYSKSPDGEVDEEWDGEKDEDALQYYKSVIESWCAVNDFYIGKENCVIY